MDDPPDPVDPLALFGDWLGEAEALEPNDPNAVTLATATADGRPSARIVLLKGHDARGFVIYTNRESRKGDELEANPRAALLFHWKSLRRQVRVEGAVSRVSDAESDSYWASRSRDSRLGAWASDQSRPLDVRGTFERRVAEAGARFEGGDVPRPDHWGGYRVAPERIEFWQDRAHRLHERRTFVWAADGGAGKGFWEQGMLYP